MAESYRVADGRWADAIDDTAVAHPITFVAYRYGTRCLRVALRKANGSVAGCRFDHRSSCRYGLGAATCPAVELNVQLSEGPLRFRLCIGSEARPMPVDLSDEFRQMHADRHLGAHPNKYADIRQRNKAVSIEHQRSSASMASDNSGEPLPLAICLF